MPGHRLVSGVRWSAFVVAGGIALVAILFASALSSHWSVEVATVTAVVGFLAMGLVAFFWIADRRDRSSPVPEGAAGGTRDRSRQEEVRRARIRPRLDYEMTQENAGDGFFRNTIWLVNRGPGGAAALRLTFDALTAPEVGDRPAGEVWADPTVLAKTRHFGPYRRPGLAVGPMHRVPIFRDSEGPSSGGTRLPLGPSDVSEFVALRAKVECSDAEGTPVDAVFDILQKAGGFYAGSAGEQRWVESWRLLS